MNKLIKGDQVIVLTGRDKGKTGKIALRIDDERVVVEGVNLVKKHVKPNPMKGETGGIVQKSMPIHQSNLAIFNTVTGKADRVSIKVDEAAAKGKRRVRVYKSSGEAIKVA
jgi:large subunit ribosomal protein L24